MSLKAQKKGEELMTKRGLKCVAISTIDWPIYRARDEYAAQGIKTYTVHADGFSALYISEVA